MAVLVRAEVSVARLLHESKMALEHLREAGVARAPDAQIGSPAPLLVIWMVPETVFDDDDWPGATAGSPAQRRLQRRRAAAVWLRRESIAIAPTPNHP